MLNKLGSKFLILVILLKNDFLCFLYNTTNNTMYSVQESFKHSTINETCKVSL